MTLRVELRDSDTHEVLEVLTEAAAPSGSFAEDFVFYANGEPVSFASNPRQWLRGLPRALATQSRVYAEIVEEG